PGQTLDGIDFVLTKGGTLAGHVHRADGKPCKDIVLFKCEPDAKERNWLGRAEDDGGFLFAGLARGPLLVRAAGRDCATLRPVSGTIVPDSTVEVELELVPACKVHARLRDSAGPLAQSEVTVSDGDGHAQPVASEDGSEAWIGPLCAGRYTVRAQSGD